MSSEVLDRRTFIKALAATGAGTLGLAAACSTQPATGAASDTQSKEHIAAAAPVAQGTPTADEMDKMHEEGVTAFVNGVEANSKTFWPAPMPFTLDGDTKVFEITCKQVQWETAPGKTAPAMAYNGVVPGPEIRVTEGDKIRLVVRNEMSESTSIHCHGVIVPNNMDGVPYITQDPIKPGGTFTYEFVARNPGSHMYHSHHNAAEQVTKGLLGPFIIEPKDKSKQPAFDKEYTIILNDTGVGLTLNGKSFPATAPLTAKMGQKLLVRFMNEGLLDHPMHLHGLPMLRVANDGWPIPQPYLEDTVNIAPGQRKDVIIDCTEPGVWAFHCHILTHAESRHGMFGMVTALIIEA
jgi:FtsP/CotA-like multicopper oxidase with cupredoxin domain